MLAAFFLYKTNKKKTEYSTELEAKNEELDLLIRSLSESRMELEKTNKAKDKFFSIIAHDLKNPLSTFITVTDFLKDDYKDMPDEEKVSFIEDMNHSAKSLYSLLENLLYWSRSQMGVIDFHPMDLDINYLVRQSKDVLFLQAQNKNISINLELSELRPVAADANMLMTVVRNLMSNAIKFTPLAGKIEVKTGYFEKYVYIRVKDSGVGIPQEKMKELFEPSKFESNPGTANEKGTGLGLVLCNEFVQKHNGRIEVESQVMEGSIFTVLIPIGS